MYRHLVFFYFVMMQANASLFSFHGDPYINNEVSSQVLHYILYTEYTHFKVSATNGPDQCVLEVKVVAPQITRTNFLRHFKQISESFYGDKIDKIKIAIDKGEISIEKYGELYKISLNGYVSRKVLSFSVSIESNTQPERTYPSFGQTSEESLSISCAIVSCLLNQQSRGSVYIKQAQDNPSDIAPFDGQLNFELNPIAPKIMTLDLKEGDLRDKFLKGEIDLSKDKKSEKSNVYKFAVKDANDLSIVFSLNFQNSGCHEMWHQMLPVDEETAQSNYFDQICALYYFRHFRFTNILGQDSRKIGLHAPYMFIPEIEWCRRIQRVLERQGYSSFICMQPSLQRETGRYLFWQRYYSLEEAQFVLFVRQKVVQFFNPEFSFFSHHRMECPDTAETKIGCLNLYPDIPGETDDIYARLCKFDGVVHCNSDPTPLKEIFRKSSVDLPIFEMYPSSEETPYVKRAKTEIFNCGFNWDKLRGSEKYKAFYKLLEGRNKLAAYGPPASWSHLTTGYKGVVPLGDNHMVDTIAKHGVSLCFHSQSHLEHNIPTARFFESVSACAMPICDQHPFFIKHFKDACFFVNQHLDADQMAQQVLGFMDWMDTHPDETDAMCRKAHTIFNAQFSLESYLKSFLVWSAQLKKNLSQ